MSHLDKQIVLHLCSSTASEGNEKDKYTSLSVPWLKIAASNQKVFYLLF